MNFHQRVATAAVIAAMATALSGCESLLAVEDRETGRSMQPGEWLALQKQRQAERDEQRQSGGGKQTPPKGSVQPMPADVPGSNTAEWSATYGCRVMPTMVIGADVDTVYARAMRTFNFSTNAQMQRLQQQRSDVVVDSRFRHDKQGGVFYRMTQGAFYSDAAGAKRRLKMDMTLAKEGSGTSASVAYCVDPTSPLEMSSSNHRHVQEYISAALRK